MAWLQSVTLTSSHVALEPLSQSHAADLIEAVSDGKLWELWYTSVPSPHEMSSEIDRRLGLESAGSMLPFAVIHRESRKAVGMTTYMNIDARYRRVEIGSTWYAKSAQRTPLNTECKLMLLAHAFESLACIAVEFRTAFFNPASRRSISARIPSGDGTAVYQSFQSSPSRVASTRPS